MQIAYLKPTAFGYILPHSLLCPDILRARVKTTLLVGNKNFIAIMNNFSGKWQGQRKFDTSKNTGARLIQYPVVVIVKQILLRHRL